jgi:hypothetical protein
MGGFLSLKTLRASAAAFALSFFNLVATFLALTALGGLAPWTRTQFVGLFGFVELGMGLAYLFAPNAWRLPVAEARTSARTEVQLAASALLLPHWIALAKALGGAIMAGYAAAAEGVAPASVLVLPAAFLLAAAFLGLSLAAARIGVARPDLDVCFVTVRRPGREPRELPGITVTGLTMQLASAVGVFPAAELLSPSVLYRPELAPSPGLLLALGGAAAAGCLLAAAAWWGRINVRAPREQQREAEAEFSA